MIELLKQPALIIITLFITLFFESCSSNPTEPEGANGKAYSFSIGSQNQIYVATNEGLYQSLDDGTTWENINRYASNLVSVGSLGSIYCMRYESDGQYTSKETLWRSTDSGKTFFATGWVRNKTIYGMEWINFNSQGHLFALQGALLGNGLHRSTSYGQNWDYLLSNVNSLIAANNIYVSTKGISRSVDNGDNWTEVLSLPDTTGDTIFYSYTDLAFNSQERIFAAINKLDLGISDDTLGMIYYSDDTGESWVESVVSNSIITHVAVNSDNNIFATTGRHEVFCSTDSGLQWRKVSVNFPNSFIRQFIISPNKNLFVRTWDNTNYAIYRSHNDGVSWERIW